MTRRHSQTGISRVITILALFAALPVAAQTLKPKQLQSLRFRFLGPVRGNRVSAVIGEPGNPSVYYVGTASGGIFKSTDGGNRWRPIFDKEPAQAIGALAMRRRGDFPRGALPSKLVNSGGLRYDNLGQFYGQVVFAIAPSPAQKGLIWAGTSDGQVWYTRNGGGHWTNVTRNIPDLPPLGVVSSIEPSPFDAATAYVSPCGLLPPMPGSAENFNIKSLENRSTGNTAGAAAPGQVPWRSRPGSRRSDPPAPGTFPFMWWYPRQRCFAILGRSEVAFL
jgi:hypothetical protein